MTILYVCRLFTGLETSLLTHRWSPTGAPAIYKVIEALDRGDDDVYFVLTCKDAMPGVACAWNEPRDVEVTVAGLRRPLLVLAGKDAIPRWLGRLRGHLRELRQFLRIARAARTLNPSAIYFDNANVWSAALLARLTRRRVILRLMGIYPLMRDALHGRKRAHRALRWAYRSPFDLVICTIDGSGGELWLEKALRPTSRRKLLLNGVTLSCDPRTTVPSFASITPDHVVVLFVGKMETFKGCDEFLDAILAIRSSHGSLVRAVMVGTGTRLASIRERIIQSDAQDLVTVIEHLPHDQVLAAYLRADIYVSINRYGNLSNTNLEAIAAGTCMIIPESSPTSGVDLITDRLLPADAVVRVPNDRLVGNLAAELRRLCDDPGARKALQKELRKVSESLLETWEKRSATEIDLIRSVMGEERELAMDEAS